MTPQPQPGNPRPRLFRLDADQAVINRLGFNSEGVEAVRRGSRRARAAASSASTSAPTRMRPTAPPTMSPCIEALAPHVSFLTVNISSPNTPGLRNLQQAAVLDELLARVIDARERAADGRAAPPVLLKIAPDLTLGDLDDVVGIARRHRIDGMMVGNTTIGRPNLRETAKAKEQGGLSGPPAVRALHAHAGGDLCARRGRVPADRRRRHQLRRGGVRQDQGRREPRAALHRADLPRRRSGRVDQKRSARFPAHRAARSLADAVGRDAAAVTAEPWPT